MLYFRRPFRVAHYRKPLGAYWLRLFERLWACMMWQIRSASIMASCSAWLPASVICGIKWCRTEKVGMAALTWQSFPKRRGSSAWLWNLNTRRTRRSFLSWRRRPSLRSRSKATRQSCKWKAWRSFGCMALLFMERKLLWKRKCYLYEESHGDEKWSPWLFYGRFIVTGKSGAAAHNRDSGALGDKVLP